MPKSNLAYSLNQRERQLNNSKSSPHIGRIKKRKINELNPVIYISLICVSFIVFSFYLTYFVKSNELSIKINSAKKQYEIQKSETTRLNSVLERNCLNAVEIEKYAKLNLGMRKQNNNQVHYINRKKDVVNKINKEKSNKTNQKNKNFFSKIVSFFKN